MAQWLQVQGPAEDGDLTQPRVKLDQDELQKVPHQAGVGDLIAIHKHGLSRVYSYLILHSSGLCERRLKIDRRSRS